MLQKKGESKERWGRAEIREMEVEERGEEKRTPIQAVYCHISEDEPDRPITIYL